MRILLQQVLRAAGAPALALGATFFAYGTQTKIAGFSVLEAWLAPAVIYTIPGQLIVVEQAALAASWLSVLLSVFLVNTRLLPMTMAVMPHIKSRYLLVNIVNAHFVALTTWLGFLNALPQLKAHPQLSRSTFYFIFGGLLWCIAWSAALLGYFSKDFMSPEWQLALVYVNPLYFLLLIWEQTQQPANMLPIVLGAVLLPPLALWNAEWSILIAGLIGGTLAFWLRRRR